MDDVRSDQFFDLVEKGYLKNISEYLTDGLYCKNCITTFPSITVPAHTTILTGQYPDSYEVPLLKWVDRNYANLTEIDYTKGIIGLEINDHLNKDVKTIYEQVNGNTFSAFEFIFRGATRDFGFNRQEFFTSLDKAVINSFLNPKEYFEVNEAPKFCACWYFDSDVILHEYGSESDVYLKSLRKIDRYIGRIIKKLKENNYFDDTLFIITSDHGNYTANVQKDLSLEKFGLIRNKNCWFEFGAVGFFNFKEENDWRHRASYDRMTKYGPNKVNLFDTILKLDGVQHIYYRDGDCRKDKGIIQLKSHDGEGIIEYNNGKTKYSYEKNDLFGYEEDPRAIKLLDGKFHSIDEWLEHTYHIDNPIIVDQLPRFLNIDKRSHDIVAVTDAKTVYHHLFSHDVCHRNTMNVPLIISGKGLEKKEIPFAKTSDITPTILKFLGEKIDPMVGKPLI
ncbi:MAG: alkaline phosphatase family protein [Candidatus Hodarchaeota archaeon]